MGAMGPYHWLVVIAVFVLLFGAKKLPDMARSIGQSARVFKTEMKGMKDDDEARTKTTEQQPALPPAQSAGPVPQAQAADGASGSDTAR
jgi:sec-independent protein translocase protein TatA